MRGLFVTGTDTGVGKTLVTAAIVRCLRRQGRKVRACKPVATGARCIDGQLLAEDTQLLAEAAGDEPRRVTPYVFRAAAAPPVAARLERIAPSLADYTAAVRRVAGDADGVIVEGVGGLFCPLTDREVVADLAAALGLPLVIVARRSLGTLNHTLLTVASAEARRLPVAGVVVSETTPSTGVAEETNVDELRRRLSVPLLAVVPHQQPAALDSVDWWKCCTV